MKKNEQIELQITDTSVNGDGIGRFSDCTFFVKGAVAGDTVRAVITRMKKGYGFAKMLELLTPSPDRIAPPCPQAARCGGCQVMELSYEKQLALKEQTVRMNLKKIGGFEDLEVLPILGMKPGADQTQVPLHYRNKMQFPFGTDKEGRVTAGFYAGRTHYIIDAPDCLAAPSVVSKILRAVKDFLQTHRIPVYREESGEGLVRHLLIRMGFRTGQIMVCLVVNAEEMPEEQAFVEMLQGLSLNEEARSENEIPYQITSICLNTNTANTNVIMGPATRLLYGEAWIEEEIVSARTGKHLRFRISPESFFQVNPVQMERLYDTALSFAGLTGQETVWDLYCGTGTISLFLAQEAGSVAGVEIVPQAIENAKENARRNAIENAAFFCGKSEELYPKLAKERAQKKEADVVVLDPPRKGCAPELLEAILETGPDRIVYVSCDSATLARDLKILTAEEAYKIEKVQPVDMFPNTVHVETVVLMSRRDT